MIKKRISFFIVFFLSFSLFAQSSTSKYNFASLNDSYIKIYLNQFNKKYNKKINFSDAKNELLELSNLVGSNFDASELNVSKFKEKLDQVLKERHKNIVHEVQGKKVEGVVYNKEYNNLFEYLYLGKMQCDSGTQLLLITHRLFSQTKNNYKKNSPVVIYQNGHVLYGEIKKFNGSPRLYGYETTIDGAGVQDLGFLNDIHLTETLSLPIEVSFYMATHMTKGSERERIKTTALQRMESIYKVNMKILKKRVKKQKIKGIFKAIAKPANWGIKSIKWALKAAKANIFGFGYTDVEEGDQFRPSDMGYAVKEVENDSHLIFKDIFKEKYLNDFAYSQEQISARDINGNTPLLYAARNSAKWIYSHMQQIETNFIIWERNFNDYREQMEKVRRKHEEKICDQLNYHEENVLLAILKNTKLKDIPIYGYNDYPYNFACEKDKKFFIQQDSEGYSALHLFAQNLGHTKPGWEISDYERRFRDAKWFLEQADKFISYEDEARGEGIVLLKNRYKETALDIIIDLLMYEDKREQKYFLLKLSNLLLKRIPGSRKKNVCIHKEEKKLFYAKMKELKSDSYLSKYVSKLKSGTSICPDSESIIFSELKNENNPGLLQNLIKQYNEHLNDIKYEDIKSRIRPHLKLFSGTMSLEDEFGKNLILEIASSWRLDEGQKIDLIKVIIESSAASREDFVKVNVFNSNALTYACLYNSPQLLGLFMSFDQAILVNTNGFSCINRFLQKDKYPELSNLLSKISLDSYSDETLDWTEVLIQQAYSNNTNFSSLEKIGIDFGKIDYNKVLTSVVNQYEDLSFFEVKLYNYLKQKCTMGCTFIKEDKEINLLEQYEKVSALMSFRLSNSRFFKKSFSRIKSQNIQDSLLSKVMIQEPINSLEQFNLFEKISSENSFGVKIKDLTLFNESNCEILEKRISNYGVAPLGSIPKAFKLILDNDCLTDQHKSLIIKELKRLKKGFSEMEDSIYHLEIKKEILSAQRSHFVTEKNFLTYQKLVSEDIFNFQNADCSDFYKYSFYEEDDIKSSYEFHIKNARSEKDLEYFFKLKPDGQIYCEERNEFINLKTHFTRIYKDKKNDYIIKRFQEYFDSLVD